MASLRRFLVLPRVIWYSARAPRGRQEAWDTYWRGIGDGGLHGDVLWDAATDRELDRCRDQAVSHLNPDLPVVDVACGNGTQAVLLADHFPKVVGIDVSAAAIARARQRAAGRPSVSFQVVDVTRPGVGRDLAAEIGAANVHIRGLLHVLGDEQRKAVTANLADVVGASGVVLLVETAFAGGALGYLERLGARLTEFPQTVARCLRAGLPVPREFDEKQLARSFPSHVWQVLASGTTDLDVVVAPTAGEQATVPAFFAVLRRRTDAAQEPAASAAPEESDRPHRPAAPVEPLRYTGGKGLRASLANARAFSANPIAFYETVTHGAGDDYRKVVWFDLFGRNVLLNDPDAAGMVLTGQVGNDPFTKDGARFFKVLRRLLAYGLFTAEGDTHLQRRRLVGAGLRPRTVAAAQPGIVAACDRLVERWRAGTDTVVDIQAEAQRLALDALTEALAGADLRAEMEEFAVLDERLEDALLEVLHAPFVLPGWVPTGGNRRLRAVRRDLDAVVGRIIARRRAADGSPALLAGLIEGASGDRGLSGAQLSAEVATLLVGGYKTTASALTWTWYLLAGHPEVAAAVRAEARSTGPSGGTYIRAVVAESLRLYPPVWGITRITERSVDVAGTRIPRGTVVTVSPTTLHRNPMVWPDPDRFRPDRWLGGAGAGPSHPHAYLPFGAGRHRCVGNHLALTVLATALAQITPAVAFAGPTHPVRPAARAFTYSPGGVHLRITAPVLSGT